MGAVSMGVLCALDRVAQRVSFVETALTDAGSPSTLGSLVVSEISPEL